METWNEKDLIGLWDATIKIDGVRALLVDGVYLSRKSKPLYNLGHLVNGPVDVEVYCGSLKKTLYHVRSKEDRPVPRDCLYSLYPIDKRLFLGVLENPTVSVIRKLMTEVCKQGYEGLVLRQGEISIKVKTVETFDVVVTGLVEGLGRNKGVLGAFVTQNGKVGTGFTDKERHEFFTTDMLGETIEVSCMSLTEDGKFRHPRFIRHRFDK